MCFVFDGSLEGLLTCIYDAYYSKCPDEIHDANNLQHNILYKYTFIATDKMKAEKVRRAVINKISYDALKNIITVYLSQLPDAPTNILKYVRLGFKAGFNVDKLITDDSVLYMQKINQKVMFENHRLLGLLRFRLLKYNVYYSPISPDYNILGMLTSHFANRFKDQDFIIHDVKRGLSSIYLKQKQDWIITDIPIKNEMLINSTEENLYQKLWKDYYKNISISERKNLTLQRQYMPRRYWDYMVEKL